MRKTTSGFTIVELLIVIVVIAILAAISIVAYNGIQQRAHNTQTMNAVTAWAKAVKLYTVDKGTPPPYSVCLGGPYGYGPDSSGTSGYQCRQDNATSGLVINPSFNTLLAEYTSNGNPTPYMESYAVTATNWFRGAYLYNTSPQRIDFVLEGNIADCPALAGFPVHGRIYSAISDSTLCQIRLEG